MRLYGAAIGMVSWIYSGYLSVTGMSMSTGAWFMLVLGAIVLIHGTALLTPVAERLGASSGPLMLVYAALMFLNQLRLETGTTMDGGMGGMDGGMNTGMAAMGADPGMVAIAVLMVASGLIMTSKTDGMSFDS